MNASVLRFASLRPGKLRLNEVTIVFCSSPSTSLRFHWPMQGPQALASTVAPACSKAASCPSRSVVARICSEPGVTSSGARSSSPASAA